MFRTRLPFFQINRVLTEESLITSESTDHRLLKATIDTSIGTKLSIFSLNLLIRKSIIFSLNNQGVVSARLNFPMQWFIDHNYIYLVNEQLFGQDKSLELVGDPTRSKTLQLKMIDSDTGQPSTTLPIDNQAHPIKHIPLETKHAYYTRLYFLGYFVGQTMYSSRTNNEMPIFTVQELQNHPDAFSHFMNGVRSRCPNTICESEATYSHHQPAILFNGDDVLEALPIEDDFKADLTTLVQGELPSYIGQFHAVTLRMKKNNVAIKIASIHTDFLAINKHLCDQDIMEKLDELATKHNIILAGDFNKKIDSVNDITRLQEKSAAANKASIFKSTQPNLQLHDTIDGILAPSLYVCETIECQHQVSPNYKC
ncbi:MAG: hypothetical protein ACYC0J_00735 [Gammaproteobacteria bacterium]